MTTVTPIVTWLLLICGWYALHVTAAIRARRQEELARVEDIAKRIEAIRDRSIAYYTGSPDAPERSVNQALLKYELQSLASWIQLLRARKPQCYDLDSEKIALRKAVTGGDFESTQRAPVAPDDPVVQALWYYSDRFIVELHEEFEKANKRG
jgi:hypothetical protein